MCFQRKEKTESIPTPHHTNPFRGSILTGILFPQNQNLSDCIQVFPLARCSGFSLFGESAEANLLHQPASKKTNPTLHASQFFRRPCSRIGISWGTKYPKTIGKRKTWSNCHQIHGFSGNFLLDSNPLHSTVELDSRAVDGRPDLMSYGEWSYQEPPWSHSNVCLDIRKNQKKKQPTNQPTHQSTKRTTRGEHTRKAHQISKQHQPNKQTNYLTKPNQTDKQNLTEP